MKRLTSCVPAGFCRTPEAAIEVFPECLRFLLPGLPRQSERPRSGHIRIWNQNIPYNSIEIVARAYELTQCSPRGAERIELFNRESAQLIGPPEIAEPL